MDLDGIAHEIWATAQLLPGDGIENGVARVRAILEETFMETNHDVELAFITELKRVCEGCLGLGRGIKTFNPTNCIKNQRKSREA